MAKMAMKAPSQPPLFRVEPFKGVNYSATPTQIDTNQSPDMLNMHIDERGALNKRTGYKRIIPQSIGPGKIKGMYLYKNQFLIAHGTKLYKTDKLPDGISNFAKWDEENLAATWESEV